MNDFDGLKFWFFISFVLMFKNFFLVQAKHSVTMLDFPGYSSKFPGYSSKLAQAFSAFYKEYIFQKIFFKVVLMNSLKTLRC